MSEFSNNRFDNKNFTTVILHEKPTTGGGNKTHQSTEEEPTGAAWVEANAAHSKKNKLIAALAGASLLITGGAVAWSAMSNGEKAPVGTETSAPIDTPEVSVPLETLTVEALELDPNATPEELATTAVERIGDWFIAGANRDTVNRSLESPLDGSDFALQEAEKNGAIYAEALYGPGWENDANTAYTVNFLISQNALYLDYYFITSDDETPFDVEYIIENSTELSNTGDTSVTEVTYVSTNNSAQNRIGTEYVPVMIERNGERTKAEVTIKKSNDHAYLASLTIIE